MLIYVVETDRVRAAFTKQEPGWLRIQVAVCKAVHVGETPAPGSILVWFWNVLKRGLVRTI